VGLRASLCREIRAGLGESTLKKSRCFRGDHFRYCVPQGNWHRNGDNRKKSDKRSRPNERTRHGFIRNASTRRRQEARKKWTRGGAKRPGGGQKATRYALPSRKRPSIRVGEEGVENGRAIATSRHYILEPNRLHSQLYSKNRNPLPLIREFKLLNLRSALLDPSPTCAKRKKEPLASHRQGWTGVLQSDDGRIRENIQRRGNHQDLRESSLSHCTYLLQRDGLIRGQQPSEKIVSGSNRIGQQKENGRHDSVAAQQKAYKSGLTTPTKIHLRERGGKTEGIPTDLKISRRPKT